MLFVSLLKIMPGKYLEAVKTLKHPQVPPEIKILNFVALFGKPDTMILFEAPNEETAADFAVQFGQVAEVMTLLAQPVDNLKWTH